MSAVSNTNADMDPEQNTNMGEDEQDFKEFLMSVPEGLEIVRDNTHRGSSSDTRNLVRLLEASEGEARRMDEERLRQIKERLTKATAPPWRVRERGGFGEYDVEGPPSGVRGAFQSYEDADLVASAGEDIPALVEALEQARTGEGRAAGEEKGWLELVPEPWSSVLRTEIYSRSRKARRILDAAAADEEGYRRAREEVRELGLDPDRVPSFDLDER